MNGKGSGLFHFIKIPEKAKNLILDQLSVAELLNLCLVSKSTNGIVGNSPKCMQRIWIKFNALELKDLNSLKLSTRKYQKIKVNNVKTVNNSELLASLQFPWRKVLIFNCVFENVELYEKLIASFAETIEELELSDIHVRYREHKIGQMKFPNLQRLLFRNVPAPVIEAFIGNNTKLENASFNIAEDIEGKRPKVSMIECFLRNNKKLTHLQLGPQYIKNLFESIDIDVKFQFNLSELLLKFPLVRDFSRNVEFNVSEFLCHQTNIEWIMMYELSSDLVIRTVWSQLPSLNRITLVGIENLLEGSMQLAMRPSNQIVHLDLLFSKIRVDHLKKLLLATPCLKILQLRILTKNILQAVVQNHRFVEEIRYKYIEEGVFDVYEELKIVGNINTSASLRQFDFWSDKLNPFSINPVFWHS